MIRMITPDEIAVLYCALNVAVQHRTTKDDITLTDVLDAMDRLAGREATDRAWRRLEGVRPHIQAALDAIGRDKPRLTPRTMPPRK